MPKTTNSNLVKWVAVGLTVLSLMGGGVAWASSCLDEVETDIKADIRDDYTRKEDFARIEQRIISQEKQLDDINKKLDNIIGKIHNR